MAMALKNKNAMCVPCRRRGMVWCVLCLAVLISFSLDVYAVEPRPAASVPYDKLIALNALSRKLIADVEAGNAEATEVRINVVVYRESLRSLMLANEKPLHYRIAAPVLMQMVQMAALLQSAAGCQTGHYISCPANLLHELVRQQQKLDLAVASIHNSLLPP